MCLQPEYELGLFSQESLPLQRKTLETWAENGKWETALTFLNNHYSVGLSQEEITLFSQIYSNHLSHTRRWRTNGYITPEKKDNPALHSVLTGLNICQLLTEFEGAETQNFKNSLFKIDLLHDVGESFGEISSENNRKQGLTDEEITRLKAAKVSLDPKIETKITTHQPLSQKEVTLYEISIFNHFFQNTNFMLEYTTLLHSVETMQEFLHGTENSPPKDIDLSQKIKESKNPELLFQSILLILMERMQTNEWLIRKLDHTIPSDPKYTEKCLSYTQPSMHALDIFLKLANNRLSPQIQKLGENIFIQIQKREADLNKIIINLL